jgi:hypothetical protein
LYGSKTAAIPKQYFGYRAIRQPQPKAKVLDVWRICEQDESRHAGFKNQRVVGFQPQANSLSNATDFHNPLAHSPSTQYIDAGSYLDWLEIARHADRFANRATGYACDAPTHRFDFWQFRHAEELDRCGYVSGPGELICPPK